MHLNRSITIFRSLAILLILLSPFICRGQFEYFNSEHFWKKLAIEKDGIRPRLQDSDTAIILVTNRVMDTSGIRFCPEKRAGGVRYFFVYSSQGKWKLIPTPTLQKAISYLPKPENDWVVYTEGMGKFFTTDVDRGMNLSAQYGINVIMMDYPSVIASRKRLGNYFFAMKNARVAYKDFAPVLDTIQTLRTTNKMGTGNLSLFFHSMGNIIMRQIVLRGKLGLINENTWVDNLILNAPCVQQRGHKKWIDQVRFAKHIYVHYNPHDFTLGGAYLLSKRNQLGMKLRRPLSSQVTYINFHRIAGKGHSNFVALYGRDPLPLKSVEHYSTLFHGDTAQVRDTGKYSVSEYRGIGWDLLP